MAEQAWWRYGRELNARRTRFQSTRCQITAYTLGAMAYLSDMVGLGDEDLTNGASTPDWGWLVSWAAAGTAAAISRVAVWTN